VVGSSAVMGSFEASGGDTVRRRGGGEDPWLCGPGFRRVCLCRGIARLIYEAVPGLSSMWCGRRSHRRVTRELQVTLVGVQHLPRQLKPDVAR
jgi:hypothetical protein